MTRSWLVRVLLVCALLVLLLAVDSVDAAKKKGSGKKKVKSEIVEGDVAGGIEASTSSTIPTPPEPSAADVAAAKEAAAKTLLRKREALKKRREKRTTTQALNAKQAKTRNNQLALRRAQKSAKDAKAKAAAKVKADALVAKKRKANTPEVRRKGHEKLKSLLKKATDSSTHIINLDPETYHKFVSEGPRPYHLMIVYTALSSSYQCHYCHVVNDAIKPVAAAHFERSKKQTEYVLAQESMADIPYSELPTFFVNVDNKQNAELFKEMRFTGAPYMLLAPPRLGTKTLKPVDFIKGLPQKYRMTLQANMKPEDFNGFVNKLVQSHVGLDAAKPGFTDLLFVLVILFAISFVGIRYGLDILLKLREVRGISQLIMTVGLILYCWCIGGGMYNIIRGTSFAEMSKDGGVASYINRDPRDQFSAEGIIIGALNLLCAAALILMNLGSFDSAPTSKNAKQSPMQQAINVVRLVASPGVCLGAFATLWFYIVSIYTSKNWHYRMGLVWRN